MSQASRRTAGSLLIVFPTVIYGGVSLLGLLINDPAYMANELRQDLWRAGHAHAGVLLVLALVVLRYVDQANLSAGWKWLARESVPAAAILLLVAFFLSVLSPEATEPNALIYLAYVGALLLAAGLLTLGYVTNLWWRTTGVEPSRSSRGLPGVTDTARETRIPRGLFFGG